MNPDWLRGSQSLRPVCQTAKLGSLRRITFMKRFDAGEPKTPELPTSFTRAAWVSFVLAIVALTVGTICIMGGQWGPGLIFVFAAVAGIMTGWQIRKPIEPRSTDK